MTPGEGALEGAVEGGGAPPIGDDGAVTELDPEGSPPVGPLAESPLGCVAAAPETPPAPKRERPCSIALARTSTIRDNASPPPPGEAVDSDDVSADSGLAVDVSSCVAGVSAGFDGLRNP
jgi:hypothetical protein